MALKHILINWNWNGKFDPAKFWQCTRHSDKTHKGDLYQLWCVNFKGNDRLDHLLTKLPSLLESGDCLILLHKNPPHSSKGDDVSKIHDFVSGLNVPNKAYIRLFGGGTEPLYFGPKSHLGILGNREEGDFGDYFIDSKGEQYKLELERGEHIVDHEHLAYIWKNYWETPKQLIYNLLEDFRFHTDGFNFDGQVRWKDHLQDNLLLWNRLNCFSDDSFMPDKGYASTQDHKLMEYRVHLGGGHSTLLELDGCRDKVKKMVKTSRPDNVKEVKEVYNSLFKLFKAIPTQL
jgi:hypothetical protein